MSEYSGSVLDIPVPAVAAGTGPFMVGSAKLEQGGATGDKVFITPLDHSRPAVAIRSHEYGHLALDRMGLHAQVDELMARGVSNSWANTMMDLVVNEFLTTKGIDVGGLPLEVPKAKHKGPSAPAAQWFMRSHHVAAKDSQRMRPAVAKWFPKRQRDLIYKSIRDLNHIGSRLARQESANAESEYHKIADIALQLQKQLGRGLETSGSFQWYLAGRPKTGRGPKVRDDLKEFHIPHDCRPGEMNWVSPPLTVYSHGVIRKIRKQPRKQYIGAFRYPVQALLPAFDGRCFGLRRRAKPGGTILIDLSSSMDIENDQLQRVMDQSPLTTIVGYSGGLNGRMRIETYYEGTIGILAQDGKMFDATRREQFFGRLNVIDLPALQWLATQPEPRYWICDGEVTGVKDGQSQELTDACFTVAKRGHITRVEDLQTFMEDFAP